MSQARLLGTVDLSDPDILDRINLKQLAEELAEQYYVDRAALCNPELRQRSEVEVHRALKKTQDWMDTKPAANPEWREHANQNEHDDPETQTICLVKYSDDPERDLRFRQQLYYKGLQQYQGIKTITRDTTRRSTRLNKKKRH